MTQLRVVSIRDKGNERSNMLKVILQVQPVIMRKKQLFVIFFSCFFFFFFFLHVSTEIANIHAHKVISNAFF